MTDPADFSVGGIRGEDGNLFIIFLNMKETNMELMGRTFQEYGKT